MKRFRVGIIGCGSIFPMHSVSVVQQANAELVAVCDIKEDRAKQRAEEYNCAYYLDYQEMIDKENLDVVHICTPTTCMLPWQFMLPKRVCTFSQKNRWQ